MKQKHNTVNTNTPTAISCTATVFQANIGGEETDIEEGKKERKILIHTKQTTTAKQGKVKQK